MNDLELRQLELDRRLRVLDGELAAWLGETMRAGDYRRHHSQVRAFAIMLREVRRRLDKPLEDLVDGRERSKTVLGLFRIWEFLRAKLAQRREPRFGPFLWLADEYAWLCYQPIYDQGLKEPPLVYLNGGYSPFTLTRNEIFQAESVPQELIRSRPLLEVMESLPFPVIGVPWYQVCNLADLPVIGHEVGHSVEADLRLTGAIGAAIDGAVMNLVRRARWNAWGSELFADLYGALACGAAFVSALANFLSTEDQDQEADGYPPASIRFRFNIEILREMGCEADCAGLSCRWDQVFPVGSPLVDYEKDAAVVAASLLDGIDVNGRKVRHWMPLVEGQQRARRLAECALQRGEISKNEPFRVLVAAYRFAYDDIVDKQGPKMAVTSLSLLERIEIAAREGLQPDLRGGEKEPTASQAALRAEALARRVQFWLDAITER